jgi:hypothetical protein
MGMLVVHHKVKNFAAWKPVYDKHAAARKAAGLTLLSRDRTLSCRPLARGLYSSPSRFYPRARNTSWAP